MPALNDGTRLPDVGFGTYPLRGDAGTTAVLSALDAGYRLIDTAVNYGNEDAVGRAVARTDVPRDEIVVTTKVPGRDHGFDETLASFDRSSAALGLEVVDLYLIHWPNPKSGDPARQRENLDLGGFALSEGEVAAITALGRPDGRLFGGDPNTHEEM